MTWAFIFLFNFFTINKSVDLNYCDIKGNVKNPGVYLVEDGEVINDIILKAGGLKKNSYVKNINLSKKVVDEMVISIMTIDEYEDLTKECPVCECEESVCRDEIEDKITTTKETTIISQITTNLIPTSVLTTEITTVISNINTTVNINTTTTDEIKININIASINELVKLPGIGEATAKKIIEYRLETPFLVIEDVLNVKGIGDKLFAKIKDYITV